MIMLVFMSLYQMVDGVFVSHFVGELALSSLNIVYPVPSIVIALSIMLASGGSAIIARTMGEGREAEARGLFSQIIVVGTLLGGVLMLVGAVGMDPIIRALGATDVLYDDCYRYLMVLMLSTPLAIYQMLFQTFFVTAGKPHLGLITTVIGGFANVLFDYVFIVRLGMGVTGAALGTSLGYSIPGLFGLFYFALCRNGTLYFVRPKGYPGFLRTTCTNGASEMVSNLSIAVTTYLFNIQMLRYLGPDGVAAITIVLYAQWLLTSVFFGFSGGVAPVISYHYGCGSRRLLNRIVRISIGFTLIVSLLVFAFSLGGRSLIIGVFVPPGRPVFTLTQHGFAIFSVSFLFTGLHLFSSAMFTAFSNGKVSAILSFLRTFLFLAAALLLLPIVLEADGIWIAVPAAEGLAFILSWSCILAYRKRYFART